MAGSESQFFIEGQSREISFLNLQQCMCSTMLATPGQQLPDQSPGEPVASIPRRGKHIIYTQKMLMENSQCTTGGLTVRSLECSKTYLARDLVQQLRVNAPMRH
jgi:hypothetical protein